MAVVETMISFLQDHVVVAAEVVITRAIHGETKFHLSSYSADTIDIYSFVLCICDCYLLSS